MVVTLEVRSIISSHNLGNAVFTENLLCYVYNMFAGALTLWYFPDKRGLGIVISNQKIFIVVKVKQVSSYGVPWSRWNFGLQ